MYSNMEGADLVITTMVPYGASDAAEKMNVPMVHTLLNPAVPTKTIPCVIMPHIPKWLYSFSHKLLERGFYFCFKQELNHLPPHFSKDKLFFLHYLFLEIENNFWNAFAISSSRKMQLRVSD